MLSTLQALVLLEECTGIDIWSPEHCRQRGVPEPWIEELADAYESGFTRDRETIYHRDRAVNQFHGVHDYRLALRLGQLLGVDVERVTSLAPTPQAAVQAIKEAAEEG